MQRPHPNYPPLLPRAALVGPLRPYPISWRNEITERLQAGCGTPISRAFLELCNLNLLEYAPLDDRNHIRRSLQNSTDRQITALSQSLTVALREYLTIGGRINSSAAASTVGAPTPPIGGRGSPLAGNTTTQSATAYVLMHFPQSFAYISLARNFALSLLTTDIYRRDTETTNAVFSPTGWTRK
ncbi:hypothetical protein BGX38DRAFT_707670 [Terfezia claveryi]|nr:hypothetical protein BGX38DRAFT_707670 [Terfezia claveryi]